MTAEGLEEVRLEVLQTLVDKLTDEYPRTNFNHYYKASEDRVIIPYKETDKFIIDFSEDILDGIRLGFVIDLDKRNSSRRKEYNKTLKEDEGFIEELFDAEVLGKKEKPGEDLKEWVKISRNRRRGLHKYIRNEDLDWTNKEEVIDYVLPEIHQFIDDVETLLENMEDYETV